MKSFRAGYYIREGLSSIFTHGFMSFASVFIIIACLIIMGSFTLVAVNVNKIIGEFEDENVVLAYVNESYSVDEARALTSAIEAIPNVRTAQFVTRENAFDSFLSGVADKSRFADIDASVFRHRFIIYVDDIAGMARTQDDLLNTQGIVRVTANLIIARAFVTLRNIVSGVSAVIVAVLLVISLFIMMNTIKLATFERRDEIAIMKIVGAENSFIRWPFVFEGFILGLLGSLFAFIAQWGIYAVVTDALIPGGGVSFIQTIPFSQVSLPLCAIFIAIGFGVGVLGSSFAIRKYLKV
ncbi:MAG: permease-like cell division protein FtsX [Oscillospiraceae bacterium]|nr:permease-like cell division protein FtsX [Oscillospiraceae bacterium]